VTLATRRLIDASATLPAADRALLSLWTQRGLDDAAMAQMTGVDPATITRRRARIVADLSTELGLPSEDVAAALTAIAASTAPGDRAEIDPADPVLQAASVSPATSSASPTAAAQPKVEPAGPEAGSRPEPECLPPERERPVADKPARRRTALWLATALVGLAVGAIIFVTATSEGGSGRPTHSEHGAASATTAAPASRAASAGAPAPRTSGTRRLHPLPGGIARASGSVGLAAGPAGTHLLRVRIARLPPAGSDHYEVWLYNSIIDSLPLGRLGPSGAGSFSLPALVTRFASIDISRQPRGTTEPSGASVLRAANPLAGATR